MNVKDHRKRALGDKPYIGWMVGTAPEPPKLKILSQEGLELIKRWEGLRTNAYKCPAGVWTIGYGHTKSVKPGMMISHMEAERLLLEDVKVYQGAVRRLVRVPLTQGQFDALVSFAFNCGVSALQRSNLLKYLNQGRYNTAKLEFGRWVYANKKKLSGLVNRRKDEVKLFEGK